VTIGAPKAGVVSELKGEVGDVIPVGETLIVLDLSGDAGGSSGAPGSSGASGSSAKAGQPAAGQESAATAVGDIKEELPGTGTVSAQSAAAASAAPPLAAPATRKLARELGVDLRQIRGTGSAGRITREDV